MLGRLDSKCQSMRLSHNRRALTEQNNSSRRNRMWDDVRQPGAILPPQLL